MTQLKNPPLVGRINALMQELYPVKTAAAKIAAGPEMGRTGEGKKDPGGYEGKSSHPSAMAATNVQAAPLGFRAKENEKDNKEDHPGAGVDNTGKAENNTAEKDQMQIGTTKSETGGDPKVEDHYRAGGKDDKRQGDRGGTEGPFNAEEIGEKYSSYKFEDVTKVAYAKMNDILADIANGVAPQSMQVSAPAYQKQAAIQLQANGQFSESDMQKVAAAQALVEQTILDARANADLVGEFLTKYAANYQHLLKQGEGGGPMGGAMEGEMGGGAQPPEMGGAPEGGGAPPEAGGDGGQEGGLDEIINALLQMGMTPEQIEQALQEHMQGGGAGGPGGPGGPGGEGGVPPEAMAGGGAPPPDMGKMGSARGLTEEQVHLWKVAHAASQRFRSGQWQSRSVQPGTKEAAERLEMQKYILEVCGVR